MDAMRAVVVLLLDCLEEDLDGLYDACPDAQQHFLQQHASVRTETAEALADASRAHAASRFYAGSSEDGHVSDHRVDRLLRQAYPAYRKACAWGDAAAIELTSRGVLHLLAQHHACSRLRDLNRALRVAKGQGCSCSLCHGDHQSISSDDGPTTDAAGASPIDTLEPGLAREPSHLSAANGPNDNASGSTGGGMPESSGGSSSSSDSSSSSSTKGSSGAGNGEGDAAPTAAPRVLPGAAGQSLHQRRGYSQSVS